MVGQALASAKHRREQLAGKNLSTPASSARSGTKRGLKADDGPSSAATTTASSSKTDNVEEKVTPDPKHVRVVADSVPTPKELFKSPEAMDIEEEGGV